jgi:hypothetical protein
MTDETKGSQLAAALAKAQGMMGAAEKDRVNPHFKSRYATLASIVEVCRVPLSSNGLAWVQVFAPCEKGQVAIETRILHTSGETLSSTCVLPVAQATPQGVGSAVTYARRFGLAALVGIVADEDDDGNEASKPAPFVSQRVPQTAPAMVAALQASVDAQGPTEADKILAAIREAATLEQLDAVVPRLKRLSPAEAASLRGPWGARKAELKATT